MSTEHTPDKDPDESPAKVLPFPTKPGTTEPVKDVTEGEVELTATASGLLVPTDSQEAPKPECRHTEAAMEYKKRGRDMTEMKCHDCDGMVIVKAMSFVVLDSDKLVEFEENMRKIQAFNQAQEKRKSLGLVLPGEENK